MPITCETKATQRDWGRKVYEVDDSAYGIYNEGLKENSVFGIRAWLWLPDPLKKAEVYVLCEDAADWLDGSNLGMVELDPKTVGTGARLAIGGNNRETEKCCFSVSAVLRTLGTDHGTVARMHAVEEDDFPDFPDISTWYPTQSSKSGEIINFEEDVLEELEIGGALAGEDGIYVLWKDHDGNPRGWETVPSLVGLDWQKRYGVRDSHLFTKGPDFTDFLGYSEPEEVEALEGKSRKLVRPYGSFGL